MKKKIIAGLLALSLILGGCGANERSASGNAEKLTTGLMKLSAPKSEITDQQKSAVSLVSMQMLANAVEQEGQHPNVTMLRSDERYYFTLADGIGVLRPYKGSEYSFMGLLPPEGTDLDDYIAFLADSNADLAEAVRNRGVDEVIAMIPEFKDDYDIDMSRALTDMGMKLPFDKLNADFSGMIEPVNGIEKYLYKQSTAQDTY